MTTASSKSPSARARSPIPLAQRPKNTGCGASIAGLSLALGVEFASIIRARFSGPIASPTLFTSSTVMDCGGW